MKEIRAELIPPKSKKDDDRLDISHLAHLGKNLSEGWERIQTPFINRRGCIYLKVKVPPEETERIVGKSAFGARDRPSHPTILV